MRLSEILFKLIIKEEVNISLTIFIVAVPPMLSIPNQLEAAYIGQDVTLECHTEAYPTSINYWTTERGDMIVSGNFNCDTIILILDNDYSLHKKNKIFCIQFSKRAFCKNFEIFI